jgi:Domain of unknown function (DUF4214)
MSINAEKAINSLSDLLILYDADFVTEAYRKILLRSPDKGGLEYYTGRLRSGVSKEDVILTLCLSEEGREARSTLPGLEDMVSRSLNKRFGRYRKLVEQATGRYSEKVIEVMNSGANNLWMNQNIKSNEIMTELEGIRKLLADLSGLVISMVEGLREIVQIDCDRGADKNGEADNDSAMHDFYERSSRDDGTHEIDLAERFTSAQIEEVRKIMKFESKTS